MDIVTYALAKKMCAAAASGISNIEISGTTMIITTQDGKKLNMTFPTPADGEDGISIAAVEINEQSHLICIMSDGTEIDAGEIKSDIEIKNRVDVLEQDNELQFIM